MRLVADVEHAEGVMRQQGHDDQEHEALHVQVVAHVRAGRSDGRRRKEDRFEILKQGVKHFEAAALAEAVAL